MEPCAPGTEDDPPIMYSTLNKQENEKERLLNQKAFLRNGKYDNVFELSYQNGTEHWYCKACECPVMGRVFHHEVGRRHTQNISNTHHNNDTFRRGPSPDEPVTVEVAPGEPLPPGFEDVGRVSQIQERLDGFKVGPLVALEYLLELQDDDLSKEPVYLCILCDKKGDPRTVLTHLASYNHISQYLQKHFPTCWRALAPYSTKQYRRNWQTTLQKIAEGIEKKFGRLKPYPIDKDKFEKDRMHFLQIIGKGRHFSENSGYTFEELVVHDELTKTHDDEKTYESSANNNWGNATTIQKPFKKRSPSPPVVGIPSKKNKGNAQTNPRKSQEPAYLIHPRTSNPANKQPTAGRVSSDQNLKKDSATSRRSRSLSSVSSFSDKSDLSEDDRRGNRSGRDYNRSGYEKSRNKYERQLPYGRRRSPSPRRRSPYRRRSSRSISPRRRVSPRYKSKSPLRRRSPSPNPVNEAEREKLRKIEEFRKLARAIENDMQKNLKQHEKNPEKHPQYNEEWKKFWNRRYKELKAEGVDVQKYDFKPEWIEFWNKRMIEIHSEELCTKKEALRKRLGLPNEVPPIKFKIGPSLSMPEKLGTKPLPMAAQPDQDNEVIVIDDKDDDKSWIRGRGGPHKTSVSPKRERSFSKRSNSRERVRDRSRSREKYSRRSASVEKIRDRNTSPFSDSSKMSRSYKGHSYRDSQERSLSRNRSRSRGRSPYSRKSKERRSVSRERRDSEWKRGSDFRESSFERDLRAKDRIRTVADLPWEKREFGSDHYSGYRNPYLPPPVMRDVTRKPVDMSLPEDDDGEEVNVVDVLRLLTALEERLGSLGPKIIDLLAQALALEKNEANSSETLLDNDINCVLFETVKEKLKGQLFTGLVDIVQERAFKKAIKKIASLIHMASQRKRQREKLLPKASPVTVPGVGVVDKAAIAKQIANALIAQGKTDVTQAELETLINAVVGMAEASKNSNKPVTTASFLKLMTSDNGNSQDKIIIPSSSKRSDLAEIEKLTEPLTPSPGKNSSGNMENLSDSDLQTLLQNFKDLSTEEQHNLINYLKKLEYQEPERVERLRKFVNLESKTKEEEEEDAGFNKKCMKSSSDRNSPFSNRSGAINPDQDLVNIDSDEDNEEQNKKEEKTDIDTEKKVHMDSEDEYSFEDVVKSVSKNVKDKEMEENKKVLEETMKYDKSKSETNLNSAKNLISNLMANINKTSTSSNSVDLLGLGTKPALSDPPTSVANVDLTKLSDINMSNLANIVSNFKNLTSDNTEKKLEFVPPSPTKTANKLNFDLNTLNPKTEDIGPRDQALNKGGPLTLNLLNRDNLGTGPNKRFENQTRSGYDDGPDRFGQPNSDRMGHRASDRFGGPDRYSSVGHDRFGSGTGGQDRFGPNGPERFGHDNIGSDRFGNYGGPSFGGPDRGFNGPDRGYTAGFGAERLPGLMDPLGRPANSNHMDRNISRPGGQQGVGMGRGAPGLGMRGGPGPGMDLKGNGNFGNRPPVGFDPMRGNQRLNQNDRKFPRFQPPGGNINRW